METMTEEVEQLLKNLKLKRMLSAYDEQLSAAEKTQASYSEFIAGLLRTQWHDRQESALEWRIRRANLPERWSLETFPWTRPNTRTWCWWARPAWAKRDSPAAFC